MKLKLLKWVSLITIFSVVAWLILYLRLDNKEWKPGYGEWSYNATESITGQFKNISSAGEGQMRIMQILICVFGGGSLAVAGLLLQKVTKNRLAEVSILGIGSINILFIYIYFKWIGNDIFKNSLANYLMPIFLIAFSIFGTFIIWAITKSKKANKNTFVIVGIAIQLLAEAISVVVVNPIKLINGTTEEKASWGKIKSYTLGNVRSNPNLESNIQWWLIISAIVLIAIIIGVIFILRRKIDTFESSEELATTSGINTKRLRFTIFMLVAILAGIASSIIGSIALLGIIAPSIARLLFKNKTKTLILSTFIIGGLMVMIASWISMNVQIDLPVGILSTAIVVPYFIFLIVREK